MDWAKGATSGLFWTKVCGVPAFPFKQFYTWIRKIMVWHKQNTLVNTLRWHCLPSTFPTYLSMHIHLFIHLQCQVHAFFPISLIFVFAEFACFHRWKWSSICLLRSFGEQVNYYIRSSKMVWSVFFKHLTSKTIKIASKRRNRRRRKEKLKLTLPFGIRMPTCSLRFFFLHTILTCFNEGFNFLHLYWFITSSKSLTKWQIRELYSVQMMTMENKFTLPSNIAVVILITAK